MKSLWWKFLFEALFVRFSRDQAANPFGVQCWVEFKCPSGTAHRTSCDYGF